MKYRGYTIKRSKAFHYTVTSPRGMTFDAQAVNVVTAKKWIDWIYHSVDNPSSDKPRPPGLFVCTPVS